MLTGEMKIHEEPVWSYSSKKHVSKEDKEKLEAEIKKAVELGFFIKAKVRRKTYMTDEVGTIIAHVNDDDVFDYYGSMCVIRVNWNNKSCINYAIDELELVKE